MNKRNMVPILLVLAVLSIGYAVYRSTGVQISLVEGNRQSVYNETMHGLMLGLCIFAGMCILGAIQLIKDNDYSDTTRGRITREEKETLSRRTLS